MDLSKFTDAQKKAITHIDGPMMVLACPGAGKTAVVTHRIAYMIENGINPNNIMALTFTRKAATEMKDRLTGLIGKEKLPSFIGTFHSYCASFLRFNIDKLGVGYNSNFHILDSKDQNKIIEDLLKKIFNTDKMEYKKLNKLINDMIRYIGQYKFTAEVPETAPKYFKAFYKAYQNRLYSLNSVDFNDLLAYTDSILKDFPNTLDKESELFKYILVDEYQDTSNIQYRIVQKLAKKYKNLHVTGDADQAIYGWRGADFRVILNFKSDYPDAEVVTLDRNFRSYQEILNVSGDLIRNNKERIDATLTANRGNAVNASANPIVVLASGEDERSEATWVSQEIKKLINNKVPAKDIAILYRNHYLSRAFEEALGKNNIPFQVKNAHNFYDRKEMRLFLAFMKFALNPCDDLSFRQIVEIIPGVGQKTVNTILNSIPIKANILDDLTDEKLGLMKMKQNLFAFMAHCRKLKNINLNNAYQAMTEINKLFDLEDMAVNIVRPQDDSRKDNIIEFINRAAYFVKENKDTSLRAFLEAISLISDTDDPSDKNRVSLMTGHAAKGLEWPVVFVVGLEETILPSRHALEADIPEVAIEEERRLCYVMMTRARDKLYMTYSKSRMYKGDMYKTDHSRFLNESGFSVADEDEDNDYYEDVLDISNFKLS